MFVIISRIRFRVRRKPKIWRHYVYFTEKKVFVALMIIQSGNGCGSTVAMRRVSPKKGVAAIPVGLFQSATVASKWYTKHQSGATSMTLFWCRHTDAWVAVGRTQKVPEKKWKWWFWRNTNGDSGEIQTPEARGIRVRLGGNGGRRKIEYYWVGNLFGNSRAAKSPR